MAIYHSDDEDVLIIRLDAKDPVRRQVMGAVQAALEQAQPPRNEEAGRFKAYAAEKLPDDWRRKSVSEGDPDATPAYRQPGEQQYAQQRNTDTYRDQQRQREEEAKKR